MSDIEVVKPILHHDGIGYVLVLGNVDESVAAAFAELIGVPPAVRQAVIEGERFVSARGGHYEVAVNASPDGSRVAECTVSLRRVFRGLKSR